jgi:N-methylhydantoinase A
MKLDFEKAVEAVEELAEALGLSLSEAALGVLEIVNNLMGQALKEISIERGIDPADFTLVPFGGSGGLHCCSLAEALSLRVILIPASAGVLSALGMTVSKPGRKLSRSVRKKSEDCSDEILRGIFEDMVATASVELSREGHSDSDLKEELLVDVCYFGQSTFLTLPFDSLGDLCRLFPRAHERRYGHILDKPIEIVSLRVIVTVEQAWSNLTITPFLEDTNKVSASRYPVIDRQSINGIVRGPTIVLDSTATIFIDTGWTGRLDVAKNLILEYD